MNAKTIKALNAAGYKVYNSTVMINGELFPLPLVRGNSKLGLSVWHSSTLPSNKEITAKNKNGEIITMCGTCPTTCPGCYGLTGNYRYNNNKYVIMMRTKLLKEYPDIYFQLVRIQIENENIQRLRIHAIGDFIPGEAARFAEVLKDFPSVKAWTYTKVKYNSEIALLDSLKNCNVVKSIIPGCGFNFGSVAYIASVFYKLKRENKSVYICRCGIDDNQHCSDCDGCSTHEYVLFLEHSTGYNARNDYGYNRIVALIESQKGNKK